MKKQNVITRISHIVGSITILLSCSLVAQAISEERDGRAFIWIEAEQGDIHSPMEVLEDKEASGGQHIEVSTGNYSVHKAPDDGQAVYRFTIVEAGTYKVWGRVIASMSDENAYWAKMDNGRWVKWADISLGCEWHWDELHDNENQNQVMEYFLTPGSHELTITYLVDDVRLDKVLITNDSTYEPTGKGPGADALFSYSPRVPVMKDTVQFDGSTSLSTNGRIVAYDWKFGDGAVASGAKPRHSYSSAGEYPVQLTVTDDSGLTGKLTEKVKIYTGQPVADYHFWPDHSTPGEVVDFNASHSLAPKGHITHYAWTFGDGTTGDGKVVRHRYASAGEYVVTLMVRDGEGRAAREEQTVAIINPVPKKIIYETDMCLDVDDVGGLAILHAMADRGEAEILAVCFNEVHPSGAAAVDAVNTWYGRGDIPVGIYKNTLFEPDDSEYLDELAEFPYDLNNESAASALDTYRQVLSDQPDHSVTIISVGFLNNLNDLLTAKPKLVEQKVKELVIMGGLINDGFNLVRHRLVSASQNVIENWPTPVVISQPGSSILTGTTLQGVSEKNPVRTAYYEFFGSHYCARPSWDQMAVLYGVRGTTTYFRRVTSGKGLLPNGYTWQMKPGVRSYLETRLPDDSYAQTIENLMTVPPSIRAPEFRKLPVSTYIDKMKAGWLGQMAGVGWGGPTEFKYKGEVMPADEMPNWKPELINQFEQDDIYVEMTFLQTLELYGLDANIRQAGIDFANSRYGLAHANRAARCNLRNGIAPPDSGHPMFNRHADDIDYQIEADYSGLICPGLPNEAIGLGEKFGRLMNYGDGLYGGQFVGGMYAEAFFEQDIERIVQAGLDCVPRGSQFHECISDVIQWHRQNPHNWNKTWNLINEKYHLNPNYRRASCLKGSFNIDAKINAAYIVMGLLYGEGDIDKTIIVSTRCGQDSDCNPSNAAGVLCTRIGYSNIPGRFTSALDAEGKFSHTPYNFDLLTEVCERLARQAVIKSGGRVQKDASGKEVFVIPVQKAKPSKLEQCWEPGPIANSRYTPEERDKMDLDVKLTESKNGPDDVIYRYGIDFQEDEFMRKWLILGPMPYVGREDVYIDSNIDGVPMTRREIRQVFGIDSIDVVDFQPKVTIGGKEYQWAIVEAKHNVIDLIELVKEDPDYKVAYFWAQIDMPMDRRYLLGVGYESGVKIWLNGELVHENWSDWRVVVDDDRFWVNLKRGKNQIVMKVQSGESPMGFCLRLLDW